MRQRWNRVAYHKAWAYRSVTVQSQRSKHLKKNIMSEHFDAQPLPRAVLLGAALLVIGSILAVSAGRYSDVGVTHMPTAHAVLTRSLRFDDRDDGAVVVVDINQHQQIEVFQPGTSGFVRGVMRGMARARRLAGIDAEPPFQLTRWSDGRMSIQDPTTGVIVNLEVFGPSNSAPFAHLLTNDSAPAT
jgi:putative photosynthetic complex assembly protein